MTITVKLDDLLHARRMTMTELSERIDLTLANVSILKTGKAKAIRFSTLEAICRELECQPGDLLGYEAGSGQSEYQPDNQDDDDQRTQANDDRTAHGKFLRLMDDGKSAVVRRNGSRALTSRPLPLEARPLIGGPRAFRSSVRDSWCHGSAAA